MIGFENEGTKVEEKMKETGEKLNKGWLGAKEAESQRAEQGEVGARSEAE